MKYVNNIDLFTKVDTYKCFLEQLTNQNIIGAIDDLNTLIENYNYTIEPNAVIKWGDLCVIPLQWIYYHPLSPNATKEVNDLIINTVLKEKNVEIRNSLISFYGGLQQFLIAGGAETEYEAVDDKDDQSAKIVKLKLNNKVEYFIIYTNGTVYCKAKLGMTSQERKLQGYNDLGQKLHVETFMSLDQFRKISKIKGKIRMNDIVGWTYNKSGDIYKQLKKRT